MKFNLFKKKALSLGLAVATAATLAAPVTANAAATPIVPTAPMTADENVITVAAHRAAETAPEFLGASLTTFQTNVNTLEEAKESPVFNVFGSEWNVSPDPYIWNYYYHLTGDVGIPEPIIKLVTQTVGPTMADSSGVSVSTNADIYLGNAPIGGYSYPAGYNTVAYKCGDLGELMDTMYRLAYAMNAVPRDEGSTSGRYGDPELIAKDYEKYIKGTQLYVLSQLEAKMNADIAEALKEDEDADISGFKLENYMKKVAIIGVNSDGTYKLYDSIISSGTAASFYVAEYVECTTYNVIDDLKAQGIDTDKVTAAQLKASGVQFLFTSGVQGNGVLTKTLTDANALPDGAVVIDQLPKCLYGISMNSVENALGVGIFQSIIYSEYLDLEDAVAYFYKDFYHLKTSVIDMVADDYFDSYVEYLGYNPDKYTASTISAAIAAYASELDDGIEYYVDNEDAFEGTKLEFTDNYLN